MSPVDPLTDHLAAPNTNFTSVVNVTQYGAIGDGVADDTAAFQKAINAIGNAGGGIVFVPRGFFRFLGPLTILPSVSLVGVYQSVSSHTGAKGVPPTDGTVLQVAFGANNESGTPFITVQHNSLLKGVVIFYPNQVAKGIPVPYPWSVALTQDNAAVTDVELLNSYLGIQAWCSRHLVARVEGQPIKIGVYVDKCYDIGRIEDVHFNPWWSWGSDDTFQQWQLNNGIAFIFARSDWEYVFNTFAFGYKYGYRFLDNGNQGMNGNFLGIGADCTEVAVQVDSTQPYGVLIANGEFTSFCGNPNVQVVVNSGRVRFVTSSFWGPNVVGVLVNVTNSSYYSSVGFTSCVFDFQSCNKTSAAGLQILGGGVDSNFILTGNEFLKDCPQVFIGANVSRGTITGNIWLGDERITSNSKGNIAIGLNAGGGVAVNHPAYKPRDYSD